MTEKELQILAIIKQDPMIQQQALANRLGCSRSAVAGHIMNLTRKGIIQGKGYIIAPEQYAVVIGGANIDLAGRSDGPLITGDSNPGQLTSSAGGVGRNIADNLARMGNHVRFISAIGDDRWGDQLKHSCQQAGINIDHCLTINGATTSSYLSIHNSDGEMVVALNDMALLESLNGEQLRKRIGVMESASAIVIDANLSENALAQIFHQHSDKAIFVDPVSSVKAEKLKPYLKYIHTFKPNKLEAELLTKHTITSDNDVEIAASILHKQGVKRLLISLGSDGAYSSVLGEDSQPNGGQFIRPSKTQIRNVTGAGDALMAGLAHGYLNQLTWHDSVNFAIAAAQLTLAADNTINSTISEDAVNQLIKQQS